MKDKVNSSISDQTPGVRVRVVMLVGGRQRPENINKLYN